jgi:2-methylcitrate dehydratase PrpD
LAYPNTAFGATHAAFLARRGITGPLEVFEGNKGFIEALAGPFEQDDYKGFHTRPMNWQTVVQKFERLSYAVSTAALRQQVVEAVANLNQIPVNGLAGLLAQVRIGAASRR